MPLFLTTLKLGGPAFTVHDVEEGFMIRPVEGRQAGFNEVARLCIDNAGPAFAAFPRADGQGGYDQVLIVPIKRQ